jgi:hypothetical protein
MRLLLEASSRAPSPCYCPLSRATMAGEPTLPQNIRKWFQSLMQPDSPAVSCCGEADAFEADAFEVEGDHYIAIITDGKGVIPNGTRIPVRNRMTKWDLDNPTGHGISSSAPKEVPLPCVLPLI